MLSIVQEPGQARRISQPASPLGGNFDFELGRPLDTEHLMDSQKSSLFPWDNAGATSSVNGGALGPGQSSDRVSIGRADYGLRGSSTGRTARENSLPLSHMGSGGGTIGFSPGIAGGSHISAENFMFDSWFETYPGKIALTLKENGI